MSLAKAAHPSSGRAFRVWATCFPRPPWAAGEFRAGPPAAPAFGRAALHEFGYALHPEKGWRVHPRRDEPEVTGVILTRHGAVRLPDRLRRVMRGLARSAEARDAQRLKGYRAYAAMVTRRRVRKD